MRDPEWRLGDVKIVWEKLQIIRQTNRKNSNETTSHPIPSHPLPSHPSPLLRSPLLSPRMQFRAESSIVCVSSLCFYFYVYDLYVYVHVHKYVFFCPHGAESTSILPCLLTQFCIGSFGPVAAPNSALTHVTVRPDSPATPVPASWLRVR